METGASVAIEKWMSEMLANAEPPSKPSAAVPESHVVAGMDPLAAVHHYGIHPELSPRCDSFLMRARQRPRRSHPVPYSLPLSPRPVDFDGRRLYRPKADAPTVQRSSTAMGQRPVGPPSFRRAASRRPASVTSTRRRRGPAVNPSPAAPSNAQTARAVQLSLDVAAQTQPVARRGNTLRPKSAAATVRRSHGWVQGQPRRTHAEQGVSGVGLPQRRAQPSTGLPRRSESMYVRKLRAATTTTRGPHTRTPPDRLNVSDEPHRRQPNVNLPVRCHSASARSGAAWVSLLAGQSDAWVVMGSASSRAGAKPAPGARGERWAASRQAAGSVGGADTHADMASTRLAGATSRRGPSATGEARRAAAEPTQPAAGAGQRLGDSRRVHDRGLAAATRRPVSRRVKSAGYTRAATKRSTRGRSGGAAQRRPSPMHVPSARTFTPFTMGGVSPMEGHRARSRFARRAGSRAGAEPEGGQ